MLEFVYSLISFISPKYIPLWLAHVIATTIALDCRPDHNALGTCELDAAAMVVTAKEEGGMCSEPNCPHGDGGISVTTWQLRTPDDALRGRLIREPLSAARRAYSVMVGGAELCPDAPLAPYAGGCKSERARAFSTARVRSAHCMVALGLGPLEAAKDACGVR